MGEDPKRIHLVGSPAVDGLDAIPSLPDEAFDALGRPEIVFMLHPAGLPRARERARARQLLALCRHAGRVLAMHPNHDPGREGILETITEAGCRHLAHLPRRDFIGLLSRVRLLVGNSSAGLIECAAKGVRCVNVGSRQAGREVPDNVIDVGQWDPKRLETAIARGLSEPLEAVRHPYGDGRAGPRTARLLATFDPREHPLTKRNAY
jgi:UDP-N-acetylglucosamine 2-epimerase